VQSTGYAVINKNKETLKRKSFFKVRIDALWNPVLNLHKKGFKAVSKSWGFGSFHTMIAVASITFFHHSPKFL